MVILIQNSLKYIHNLYAMKNKNGYVKWHIIYIPIVLKTMKMTKVMFCI